MEFSLDTNLENANFRLHTQQQIAKDFAKFNLLFPEHFEKETLSTQEIQDQIALNLTIMIRQGETRLLQLLYTIDLAEKDFLETTTHPDFIERLTHLIIRREAYKVFLRSKF